MTTARNQFETWAITTLGDNPTWRESGNCELAWQAWQAAQVEPTAERAWFTVSEFNALVDKKVSENPDWVMPKDETERKEGEQHMKQDEVLKLALEALKTWAAMQPNTTSCAIRIPAIAAIKEALAQSELMTEAERELDFLVAELREENAALREQLTWIGAKEQNK